MLLRTLDIVVIFLFFGTIPVIIKLKTGFNYYWDYVGSQFHDESRESYDFIVGKLYWFNICLQRNSVHLYLPYTKLLILI